MFATEALVILPEKGLLDVSNFNELNRVIGNLMSLGIAIHVPNVSEFLEYLQDGYTLINVVSTPDRAVVASQKYNTKTAITTRQIQDVSAEVLKQKPFKITTDLEAAFYAAHDRTQAIMRKLSKLYKCIIKLDLNQPCLFNTTVKTVAPDCLYIEIKKNNVIRGYLNREEIDLNALGIL